MNPDKQITLDKLTLYLYYDPVTGHFTRMKTIGGRKFGSRVGSTRTQGHMSVMIEGTSYRLHHLAWLYMTGEWPTKAIKHINGDRTDNSFFNLKYC